MPTTPTASAQSESSFLTTLRNELHNQLAPEIELTLRVAVMSAAGFTRAQIVGALESTDIEVKMALIRLKKVAVTW